MADKCQKLTSLNISHSKLKTLDLGLTPNLKKLDLKECKNLLQLHVPIGCLENLVYLNLRGCLGFTSFMFDKRNFQFECFYIDDPKDRVTRNLKQLIYEGLCACTNLETLSESTCGSRCLRKLKLEAYPEAPKKLDHEECLEELSFSMTNMKHLPDSICMLKHLEVLQLKHCWSLEKLPEDIGRLECLKNLTLSDTKIKHLPDSICMLKHLVFLELRDCSFLEKLPEDLGQLECLETLYLLHAKIEHLPDSICMLKHLRTLAVHCSSLKTLPKDLGQLECLETLYLSYSVIKHLPDSICMLKDLKQLDLIHCSSLEKLPEDLDQLECLRRLSLRKCKLLRDFPISICKIKRLEILGGREAFLNPVVLHPRYKPSRTKIPAL
ncbi:disease resistance protein RPV1-like [Lactuca sativa]|uniref:disease resistance protein RPV1-like n=1 Tax=Lactuca sativa TaxID=4236 RepID=UPI0022AF2F5E|nr:disease resistance protein RPV1-like [Lactuca sativa]